MDFFNFVKDKKIIIIIVSVLINICLLASSGYLLYQNLNYECKEETPAISLNDSETKEETPAVEEMVDDVPRKFYVEVKGAVKKPGVYEMTSENIINDVISKAGGFTKTAYTNNINLSKKVVSELVVYVYTKTEYQAKLDKNKEEEPVAEITPCICPTYDISECTDNYQSEIVPSNNENSNTENKPNENNAAESSNSSQNESASANDKPNNNENANSNQNELININKASKEELMNLNGIGSSKADLIIAYRNSNGSFKTIDEIKNVSGIGDAVFAKIKDYITV